MNRAERRRLEKQTKKESGNDNQSQRIRDD